MESVYKVSFIVPVYNTEKYLDKCVDSLVNQSLKEIEIILVDDGSKDSSGLICDKYADLYSNISVIHKNNAGLGMARNSGIEAAKGEYIGFVDSDDFVASNMAEVLYANAKKYNADASYGAFVRFFDETKIDSKIMMDGTVAIYSDDRFEDYYIARIGTPPDSKQDMNYEPVVWSGIFRHRIIEENQIRFVSEREIISEDIIFDIEYLQKCNVVVHSDIIVYYYRYNPKSLTSSYVANRFERNVQLYYEMSERLKDYLWDESMQLALDRYFVAFTRLAVMQEAIYLRKNRYKYAKQRIKEICQNSVLIEVLNRYPYKQMSLKYRIYCWWQKKQHVFSLIFFTFIIQALKGRVKK